jgi:hypothetical protein
VEVPEVEAIKEKKDSKLVAAIQSLSFDNIDYGDPSAILQTL